MIGELRWFGKRLDTQFNELRLIPISDLHYGNPLCSVKHFLYTIKFIQEHDNAFGYLNGDLIEAVVVGSKGDIFRQKMTPEMQRDEVIDLLKPIKSKLIGSVCGNHEKRIYDRVGLDIMKDISKALEIPYRPEGMVLKIMFGSGNSSHDNKPFVFWGYTSHGYGGARTKSAKAIKAERPAGWVSRADFITISHDHVVNASPDVDFVPDNRGTEIDNGFLSGKIVEHRKELIKTNAYLKWGGYAEMGGFPPSDLATPVIWLLTPKSELWNELPGRPKCSVRVIV